MHQAMQDDLWRDFPKTVSADLEDGAESRATKLLWFCCVVAILLGLGSCRTPLRRILWDRHV